MERGSDCCAFKEINESPIILDFSGITRLDEVHGMLKKKFGLPEYYGENWDALWDCLDYLWTDEEIRVELHGYQSMSEPLRDSCAPMLEVFDDVHADTPNVVFVMVS